MRNRKKTQRNNTKKDKGAPHFSSVYLIPLVLLFPVPHLKRGGENSI
jgi:hypothetical protein